MRIVPPPETKVTRESLKAYFKGKRTIVNQGGTRSGKTYSLIQCLIYIAHTQKLAISICSLSFPHLRRGAMRDWREIMEYTGLYDSNSHQKTENTYYFSNGSYIEFFSVDNALKVRGPSRDILFINEANLIDQDTYRQLSIRTTGTIFIDYNPADEFHWIYDVILPKKTTAFIQSTYLDNKFLKKHQIEEIEGYKIDENFWRVFGMGERGHSEGIVYSHWSTYHTVGPGNVSFGLDFGFNNPTALVKVTEKDKEIYAEEVIHQSHLTNSDLIPLLKQHLPPHSVVYCDSAEPQRIAELQRAGISARPANKDVKDGILFLKSRKMHICATSPNMLKEIKSYKFIGKENKDLIPLKVNDHAMDAMRYAVTGMRLPGNYSQPMFIR